MPAWKFIYTNEIDKGFEILASEQSAKKPKWELAYYSQASASGGTSVSITTPTTRKTGRDIFDQKISIILNFSAPPAANVKIEIKDQSTGQKIDEVTIPYEAVRYMNEIEYEFTNKSTSDVGNKNLQVNVSGAPSGSTTTTTATSESEVKIKVKYGTILL